MLLKALLLVCGILAVQSAEINRQIRKKTLHSDYFNGDLQAIEGLNTEVQGTAVVLKSNLPIAIQNKIAATLTQIYQNYQDETQRVETFQASLSQIHSVYWNVVTNFDVIAFYSRYYIYLQIDQDRVLGFGFS